MVNKLLLKLLLVQNRAYIQEPEIANSSISNTSLQCSYISIYTSLIPPSHGNMPLKSASMPGRYCNIQLSFFHPRKNSTEPEIEQVYISISIPSPSTSNHTNTLKCEFLGLPDIYCQCYSAASFTLASLIRY